MGAGVSLCPPHCSQRVAHTSLDSPCFRVHRSAFLSPSTLLSCHGLGWVISILLHPGLGSERLPAARPPPPAAATYDNARWARRHGHPHLTAETMRLRQGTSYFRGPAGRFTSREPDSSPQGGAARLCTWPCGGILLYYFPGSLLIVRTKRLARPLNTARCVIVQNAEPVTQNFPS